MPYYRPGRSVAKLITYNNVFVGMSVSTRVPILTASPEKASAIVRTPGAVTAHPFQSLLVYIGEQATPKDLGISHTINPMVGVEYASHSDGTIRYKYYEISWTISKQIRMNNQGSQRNMDIHSKRE